MRFLLVLLAASTIVLAGCSDKAQQAKDDAKDVTNGLPNAPAMSDAQAETLIAAAMSGLPDVYGLKLVLTANQQSLNAVARFDNTTKDLYANVKAQAGGMAAMFFDPVSGTDILITTDGFAARRGETVATAAAVPQLMQGVIPNTVIRPDELLAGMAAHVDVSGIVPIDANTYEISFKTKDDQGAFSGKARVTSNPIRILSFEATYPTQDETGKRREGMTAGGTMKGEFLYGSDVPPVAEGVSRALALGLSVAGRGGDSETWRFVGNSTIPLAELEALVQAEGNTAPAKAVTKATLALPDRAFEEGGVRMVFEDADADGTASQGDSLTFQAENGSFVMKDLKTGLYITTDFFVLSRN